MRLLVVVLALGAAACLALDHHDGPWPCMTSADCTAPETCVSLTGLGSVCAAPGSCRANQDCDLAFPDEGLVCNAQFCGAPLDSGVKPTMTDDMCTAFATCGSCVNRPASLCEWCSTGGCFSSVNAIGASCSKAILATPFDCQAATACSPCLGGNASSSVCGGVVPTECDCGSVFATASAPSDPRCMQIQSSTFGPTWCCP